MQYEIYGNLNDRINRLDNIRYNYQLWTLWEGFKVKITKSIKLFLDEISEKHSENTLQKYDAILDLFVDYLIGYGDVPYKEDRSGELTLTAETQDFELGHASGFLEWFLLRKVLGPQWIIKTAPNVIKKYFQWLEKRGLLAGGVIEEAVDTARRAAKNLPRVEKASSLLFALCDKNRDKYMHVDFGDGDYMEGYGEVTGIIEDKLFLDYGGEKIGPIQITREIARHLRKDDTVNLVVGRKGKKWYPLEAGNVYPG